MGLFRAVKSGVSSGFRVKRWIGVDRIRQNVSGIKDFSKGIFKGEKTEEVKDLNFQECLKHYHMSEEDLKLRMQQAKKWISFCIGLSVFAFAYMFFQFHAKEFIAAFVCFMVGMLTLVYAFREHFNLFQMRQRRLGCTITEWFTSLISRGNK